MTDTNVILREQVIPRGDAEKVLSVHGLTKYYSGVAVVKDASFVVRPGEVTGYLGPNGSGKSTTVKMITGFIEPSSGKVFLNGQDTREDMIEFKRRLGYVPEEAILYSYMTGLEYLEMIGRLREMPESVVKRKANDLLEIFSLHPHRHVPMTSYSKGMRQRVLISAALLHNPDVLILDEPLSGLDVTSAQLFKQLLQGLAQQRKTILYISHVLEVVEKVCSHVVIIYRGKIVADDSVDHLRDLMNLHSLEQIFSQVVEQRDLVADARNIISVMNSYR
jgi:ABC-2 type transport system ATP-binding protein